MIKAQPYVAIRPNHKSVRKRHKNSLPLAKSCSILIFTLSFNKDTFVKHQLDYYGRRHGSFGRFYRHNGYQFDQVSPFIVLPSFEYTFEL